MEDSIQSVNTSTLSYCRLCAKQKNSQGLLDLGSDRKAHDEYIELIHYLKIDYLDLSLTNILPKTTCEQCNNIFQEAYSFFKRFCDRQIILQSDNEAISYTNKKNIYLNGNQESNIHYLNSTFEDSRLTSNKQSTRTNNLCCFCAKHNEDISHLLQNETSDEYPKIVKFFKISCLLTHTMFPNCCQPCYMTLQRVYNFFVTVEHNQPILNSLFYFKQESILSVVVKTEKEPLKEVADHKKNVVNFCAVTINTDHNLEMSWTGYPWECSHCQVMFESAEDLRSHSKEKHDMCFAFSCADCESAFGTYDNFVEHVRQHRDVLRLYCQYCNAQFTSTDECSEHVNTHYVGTQKICDICGEMLPYANTLLWHKQLYGKNSAAKESKCERRSWIDYDWSCQVCLLKLPDVESLRTHTQKAHDICFAMKCADCSKTMKNYKVFVPHVTAHRPYLRNYCQYCNGYFDSESSLNQHIVKHITSQQRPCPDCGLIFADNTQLARHKKTFSPNILSRCDKTASKRKKHAVGVPRKTKRQQKMSLTSEDLTCSLCGKLYQSLLTLNRHVKTHDVTRPRDFVCQTCNRAFLTKNTMLEHAKTHSVKTEVCQVCQKEFHTKHKLKAHIVTHLESRPFVCDECGNSFKTRKRLKCHLKSHSSEKPYKCMYCFKDFKFKENMKTHEYQHTGLRPYSCEICDRTFTNWANCNKHMIRKHGVSLARTKITSQGRVAIDRKTGEANRLPTDKSTTEWLDEMMKPERRGKAAKQLYL